MSDALGQDERPLRLCTDETCSFHQRHVENCNRCFGWGTAKERPGKTHRLERHPPLPASALEEALASGDWERCTDCGGTPYGREASAA